MQDALSRRRFAVFLVTVPALEGRAEMDVSLHPQPFATLRPTPEAGPFDSET